MKQELKIEIDCEKIDIYDFSNNYKLLAQIARHGNLVAINDFVLYVIDNWCDTAMKLTENDTEKEKIDELSLTKEVKNEP